MWQPALLESSKAHGKTVGPQALSHTQPCQETLTPHVILEQASEHWLIELRILYRDDYYT